jgi:hypothetical protein
MGATSHALVMRAAILIACLCSCVAYDETVHVHVRDPGLVEVLGTQPREESLPSESIERRGDELVAVCPSCVGRHEQLVVDHHRTLDLPGDPSHVNRDGETVHLDYDYQALFPCHRGHGDCERPAFTVNLATPRSNIVEIRDEKHVMKSHGELTGAKIGAAIGIAASLFGLGLASYAAFSLHSGIGVGVGAMFVGVGGTFATLGFSTLAARDSNDAIAP